MQIRIGIEAGRSHQQPVCFLGAAHIAEIFIAPYQSTRCNGRGKSSLKKSGGAGFFAFTAQHQWLADINPALFVVFINRIDTLYAQLHLGLAAFFLSQIFCRTAIHKNLPHIVFVVDQQRLAIAGPAAAAVGCRWPGGIVLFVMHRNTQLCREIFQRTVTRIERMPMFVLIDRHPFTIGRELVLSNGTTGSTAATALEFLHGEFANIGCWIDHIQIGIAAIVINQTAITTIIGADSTIAIVTQRYGAHGFISQLCIATRGQIKRATITAIALQHGAYFLHRLHHVVVPAP